MKRKYAGIWLDRHQAIVVIPFRKSTNTVFSKMEDFHPRGGYGGAKSYTAQDAISESTLNDRRAHQLQQYFSDVMNSLPKVDQLYIFGPGDTKIHFQKALQQKHGFRDIPITIEAADSMTMNQIKAKVHDFFENQHA